MSLIEAQDLYEKQTYFMNTRRRDPNKRDFKFDSERIDNSPYLLVKNQNRLQIIKEGEPAELGFRHVSSVNLTNQVGRTPMTNYLNEKRFSMPPDRFGQ